MLSSPSSMTSRDAHHELQQFMEEAGDVVFRLNPLGEILFASQRASALIACGRELRGQQMALHVASLDLPAFKSALGNALLEPGRVEMRIKTPEHEVWHELRVSSLRVDGNAMELLLVGRDMTAQRATEERLRHMATHDALTELPNRLLLSDRIRMVIAQARRSGQGFSVATVGLDGFKKVNDGLGHPIGDAVLHMAAARLRKTLRDSDTLARVGGDEFVAVLPGTATEAQIKLVTGRLIATLQSPFEIESHTIYVGASVGVAVYPQHAEDEVRLVALADAAMSRAKETGKARCVVYSQSQSGPPEHDISLEAAMFQAVREGEFLLYYQPIVDARTREIQGFETLMRWKHPTLGMVPPARFIPIAETNGLINLLGAWALKAACVQLRQFQEVAQRPLYMSVNISPRQFRNDKFLVVQHVEEFIVAELPRADINRHVQRALGHLLELLELHAGGLQRPGAEQVDQAVGLGDRDEARRRHHAQRRVLPAHQRLEALDFARVGIDDGLVVQQELALAHRLKHRRFERDVVFRRAAVALVVDHAAGLAGLLGARHGRVGQRHQFDLVLGVLRIDGHADRGADVDGVVVDFKRCLQGGDQPSGDQLDLRLGRGAGQHGDEFIAADAGQGVAVAQGLAQARGGHVQHGVADRVAEAVVDFLEAVQSHRGHRKTLAGAARLGDHHADAVRQQQAVGQLGEGVVGGHVAQPLLGGTLGRHVAADQQQLHRVAVDTQAGHAQLVPHLVFRRLDAHLDPSRLQQGVAERALEGRQVERGHMQRHLLAAQLASASDQGAGPLAGKQYLAQGVEPEDYIACLFHELLQFMVRVARGHG